MMPNLSARPQIPSPIPVDIADTPAPVEDVPAPDAPPAAEDLVPEDDQLSETEDVAAVADASLPPSAAPPSAAHGPSEVVATTFLPAHVPLSTDVKLPASSQQVRDFVRQAAKDRWIDPDVAVRVVLSEGGMTPATWIGDRGSSFGPFQLHYGGIASGGNSVAGLGDAFTADTHLRADDPRTWRQQVEWALDRASTGGWGAWHGAAGAGLGPREGIGVTTRPTHAGTLLPAGAHQHVAVPNQFAAHLSVQDAYAACGPVAAVAVARFLGRNPTVGEALQLAKSAGWTTTGGMNGISNEKKLLDAMHIPSQVETALNWRHVQANASNGTPVILSTPNHYWVVDDYDPITREYHVGQSGLAYRNGTEWMTADRIEQLGGGLNGGLYIDHPLARRDGQSVPARSLPSPVVASAARHAEGGGATAAPAGPVTTPGTAGTVVPVVPVAPVAPAAPAGPPVAPSVSEHWWEDPRMDRRSALHTRVEEA